MSPRRALGLAQAGLPERAEKALDGDVQAIEHVVGPPQPPGEPVVVVRQQRARALKHGLDHVGHPQGLARRVGQGRRRHRERSRVEIARRGRIVRPGLVGQRPLEQAGHGRQRQDEQEGERCVEQQVEGHREPAGLPPSTATASRSARRSHANGRSSSR
jgi:hypothetical protein